MLMEGSQLHDLICVTNWRSDTGLENEKHTLLNVIIAQEESWLGLVQSDM